MADKKVSNKVDESLGQDQDTLRAMKLLTSLEDVKKNRVPGVRNVIVVLSSKAMAYDMESLRHRISNSYPESAIFFLTTSGESVGIKPPRSVDLIIDLTGPWQKQGLLFALKMRRTGKIVVGRVSGLFRKKVYDRIFDENILDTSLSTVYLQREAEIQKRVLALAGVSMLTTVDLPKDQGKTVPLESPPYQRL